jgi:hypothetical protein
MRVVVMYLKNRSYIVYVLVIDVVIMWCDMGGWRCR